MIKRLPPNASSPDWSVLRARSRNAPVALGDWTVEVTPRDQILVWHGSPGAEFGGVEFKDREPLIPRHDKPPGFTVMGNVGMWFASDPENIKYTGYGALQGGFLVPPGRYAVFEPWGEDSTESAPFYRALILAMPALVGREHWEAFKRERRAWRRNGNIYNVGQLTLQQPNYRKRWRAYYKAQGLSGFVLRASHLDMEWAVGQREPHDVWMVLRDRPLAPVVPWGRRNAPQSWVYHATQRRDLLSIRQQGLLPRRPEPGMPFGADRPAVFFAYREEDARPWNDVILRFPPPEDIRKSTWGRSVWDGDVLVESEAWTPNRIPPEVIEVRVGGEWRALAPEGSW